MSAGSGARRRLRWCFLLLLLGLPSGLNAQPIETSGISSSSRIEKSLDRLELNSQQLELLLSQRKLKRERLEQLTKELLRELAKVRSSLEDSLKHSENSIAEIQSLTASLERSEKTSESLQTSFDEYTISSDQAIRDARIQGAAIGAGIVAAIWAVVEILRAIF